MYTLKQQYVISGAVTVGIVLFLVATFYILYEQQQDKKIQDSTIDLIVSSGVDSQYVEAKGIASKATELLAIRHKEMYKSKASLYKGYMSDDVWNQFFKSGGENLAFRDIAVKNKKVKGHIFSKGEYLFKVDVELTNAGVLSELAVFVQVDNGIITHFYTQ